MLCSGKSGLLSVSICQVRAGRERPFAGMRQVTFGMRPASQRDSATASRLSPALSRVGDHSASAPSTRKIDHYSRKPEGAIQSDIGIPIQILQRGARSAKKRPSAETMLLSQKPNDGTMPLPPDLVAACLGETWVRGLAQ